MSTGFLLSNIALLICLALGLLAIFRPEQIQSFISIRAVGKEGKSEIKSTYGGFFVGLSIYALAVQSADVFMVIGIGWLSASFIRFVGLFRGLLTIKNVGGVFFEALIGVLCLSNLIT